MRCQYVLKQFSPDKMLNTPFGITAAQLRKMGKTTILTDLDNTLLAWDQLDATDEVINWFTILKEEGIKVMIFSNNNEERVARVAKAIDVPYLARAKKPLGANFRPGIKRNGCDTRRNCDDWGSNYDRYIRWKPSKINNYFCSPCKTNRWYGDKIKSNDGKRYFKTISKEKPN